MGLENFENNPLEEEKIGIENATSFDMLYEILKEVESIRGTQKTYDAETLRKKIEQARHGHKEINVITRSYGIRDAVERLLENDRVYQKYVLKKKRV